jgi:ribonuclease HI
VIDRLSEGIGVATNNVAEYRAALAGLARSAEVGATQVVLRSDSKLLVEQLSGRYRVKNPTLVRLHGEVRALLDRFDQVRFEHVPRERNREADRLANAGVDQWLAGPGRTYRPPEPAPNLFEGTE